MQLNTVIFDMDGLLIDSEPLWQEAGQEALSQYDIQLTDEQYHSSTGLRTPEWIDYWFSYFQVDKSRAAAAITTIEDMALQKINKYGIAMPGVEYILEFFQKKNFKIGLASSSPVRIIEMIVDKLSIRNNFDAITSAESLAFGKPHPQVFINCAGQLGSASNQCIVFEDSFNGMIAAKAAKMKCVVIPHQSVYEGSQWSVADLKIDSLTFFTDEKLSAL